MSSTCLNVGEEENRWDNSKVGTYTVEEKK